MNVDGLYVADSLLYCVFASAPVAWLLADVLHTLAPKQARATLTASN